MKTRIALCVLFSVAVSSVQASPDDDAETENKRIITVQSDRANDFLAQDSTVGGKFPTPARDIPQQLTVISQELMTTHADTSLYGALDNIPGIVITPSADTATGNNINLRGFHARTDIYLDGFRDRGQYFRDTFALETVEVLEGAASHLFGHGSTWRTMAYSGVDTSSVSQRGSSVQVKRNGRIPGCTDRGLLRFARRDVGRHLGRRSAAPDPGNGALSGHAVFQQCHRAAGGARQCRGQAGAIEIDQ